MERVETIGFDSYLLRTRQVGPNSWCCDVYERLAFNTEDFFVVDEFAFQVFGESETESVATALHECVKAIRRFPYEPLAESAANESA